MGLRRDRGTRDGLSDVAIRSVVGGSYGGLGIGAWLLRASVRYCGVRITCLVGYEASQGQRMREGMSDLARRSRGRMVGLVPALGCSTLDLSFRT